jgi:flavin-dependent dehydrogenase
VAVAVRAYFEEVKGLADQIQLRFDGVPLPGYGWVFPLPNGSANIGAGVFPSWWNWQRTAHTARAAYEAFIQGPALRAMLQEAHQLGPVKGYPLRVDFATAPTYGQRLLLVGEAAGLVNPLTGEGIDYALESGKLAAEHMIQVFNGGDFSLSALADYDRLLRHRFQRLFIVCNWIQNLLVNPLLLDTVIRTADRRPDLKMLLINIVFGQADLHHFTFRRVVRNALKLSRGRDSLL